MGNENKKILSLASLLLMSMSRIAASIIILTKRIAVDAILIKDDSPLR